MTKDETLRLALEALEKYTSVVTSVNDPNTWIKVADGGKPAREAITAIKAVLEAKDEPVACKECHLKDTVYDLLADLKVANLKLSVRSQRTWAGLTDEDIGDEFVRFQIQGGFNQFEYAVKAIEAKLKEKNT